MWFVLKQTKTKYSSNVQNTCLMKVIKGFETLQNAKYWSIKMYY